MNAERPKENAPALITRALPDYHLLRPNVVAMPMQLRHASTGPLDLLDRAREGQWRANLSTMARDYLAQLSLPDPDADLAAAELVWLHAFAICYAPQYLSENEDGVKRDFPRVPLPPDPATLRRSAVLGAQLADLLDPDQDVSGVTAGTIAHGLRVIGNLTRIARDQSPVDLRITSPWGYAGRDGVIMPGTGRVEPQDGWPDRAGLETALRALAASVADPLALLGAPSRIFLNEQTYWALVPNAVWGYRIGGYQVVKKWLSYRQHDLLGRPLTVDESRHVTNMIRRLTVMVLLTDELNANYRACRDMR
jgi:Type ISP C-terminal specificity domain